MGFTNAYYVHVVAAHARPIGGIQKSSWDRPHFSMLIDGYVIGNTYSTFGPTASYFLVENGNHYFPVALSINRACHIRLLWFQYEFGSIQTLSYG